MKQSIASAVNLLAETVREVRTTFHDDRELLKLTMVGLIVVSGSSLVCAKLLDDVMGADGAVRADPSITKWIVQHRTPTLTALARAITHLGDPLTVIVIAAVATLALLATRRYRFAFLIVASTVGASAATTFTKYAVDRPRPDPTLWLGSAAGPAFPSGHATQSVALYAALAVVAFRLTNRSTARLAILAVATITALTVGGSRIYLAVHWTSDVICGWAVATAWLATLLLTEWSKPRALATWRARERSPGRVAFCATKLMVLRPSLVRSLRGADRRERKTPTEGCQKGCQIPRNGAIHQRTRSPRFRGFAVLGGRLRTPQGGWHGRGSRFDPDQLHFTSAEPPRNHRGTTAEPPRNHRGTTAEPPRARLDRVRRVSVVGVPGSGKTTFARALASKLDLRFVELDEIHHQPDWVPLERDEFRRRVDEFSRTDDWVIDGNYSAVRDLVWARAATRKRLWNGNVEPLSNLYSLDPEKNLIVWAWVKHPKYRRRYAAATIDSRWSHATFVRLGTPDEVSRFLAAPGSRRE